MTRRRLGIPGTDTISWGQHVCMFFYTKTDLLNLVVPYIKAGLEDDEFCLWVLGDTTSQKDALAALEAVLPRAQDRIAQKQLEIVPYRDWYFSSDAFDAQKAFDNWASRTHAVRENGFTGARTTGNPFWLTSNEDWAEFLRYEKTVQQAITTQQVISLCTYPIDITNTDNMLRTFAVHHSMLLGQADKWRCLALGRH